MESATEHQGRILLVDDESAILRTFRYCLEDEGYTVATANSAAQADALNRDYPTLPRYPQPDGRVKLAAGWLIEQAGWKGKALGPVGMYEKQALVLVNRGGATGDDVRRTMAAVQADVQQRFGVALTPEPIFL